MQILNSSCSVTKSITGKLSDFLLLLLFFWFVSFDEFYLNREILWPYSRSRYQFSRLHNEDSSLFLNHSYSAFSSSTTFTSCCPVSRGLIWSFCGVSSDKSPICHSVSCIRRLLPSLLSQHACYVTRVLANVPTIHWNWSGYKVQVSLWSVCTAHCSYCYSPNLT